MRGSTARQQADPRLPAMGERLDGRFELLEVLGEGGMGHVYRAFDRRLGCEVALKLLAPRYLGRPEREERLLREFELGKRAEHHRSLVEVLDGGRLRRHDWPFVVMELVPGRDLARRLTHGPLESPLATRLARQVAGAVRALHRAGVVHRDVTTTNVLIHEADAVLIDFSHAAQSAGPQSRADHRRLTRAHEVPGTHHSMPPEQARGEPAHPAMDVYAFGVMLVHMLTGTAPGACGREAFIELQSQERLRPPRIDTRVYQEVPLALAELVDACTGLDPKRRPTMDDVVQRLDALLVVMAIATADPSEPVPAANADAGSTEAGGARPDEAATPEPVETVESGPVRAWKRLVAPAALVLGVLGGLLWPWTSEPEQEAGVGLVVGLDAQRQPEHPGARDMGEVPPTPPDLPHDVPRSPERGSAPQVGVAPEPAKTMVKPVHDDPPDGVTKRAPRSRPAASHPDSSPNSRHKKSCPSQVAQAHEARRTRRWSSLDRLTRSGACWDDPMARARLRVKALSELGWYDECMTVGKTIDDPEVSRLVAHCADRIETEAP